MKKIIEVLAVVMILGFSANAFAVVESNTNESNPGEAIKLTDGTTELVLNFSPSIMLLYQADSADDSGNKQWFSVSTYHAGGTNFYASSSDSTSIYKQSRTADKKFADVIIPSSKSMTEGTGDAATTYTAEEYWLAKSWKK